MRAQDLFFAIRDFGKLALKEVDVGFEVVLLPHLDVEEVMAIFLSLLVRGLGKKHFGHLYKVVKIVWWQGVEPIRDCVFQTKRKSEAYDWIIKRVDHYLVPKVSEVLN